MMNTGLRDAESAGNVKGITWCSLHTMEKLGWTAWYTHAHNSERWI